MSSAIRYGMLSGFLACLASSLMYVYNPSLFLDFALVVCLIITMLGMIMSAKYTLHNGLTTTDAKNVVTQDKEVFITFPEMLAIVFRVFLISYIITFVFMYLLFNVYDTSLVELVKQRNIELLIANKDSTMTEELFQQRIKEVEKIDFSPRLSDIVSVQSLFRLVIGFFIALVLAFAFKRDKPSYLS